MARYIPNTEEQQKDMLHRVGVSSIQELFADIPESIQLKEDLNIPSALQNLSWAAYSFYGCPNASRNKYAYFLGAGITILYPYSGQPFWSQQSSLQVKRRTSRSEPGYSSDYLLIVRP